MLELEIDSIRVNRIFQSRVVLLKDKNSDRYLPIYVGTSEASAIANQLQDYIPQRPMTHDLLYNVILAMGGVLHRIIVWKIENDIYHAKLVVGHNNNNNIEIDARPSDAINIAIRAKVPIYASDEVMNVCSIIIDEETGMPVVGKGDNSEPSAKKNVSPGPVGNNELVSLSAFEDFVESLDLKDIGKSKLDNEETVDDSDTSAGTS
jgi:hypothetical protein